MVIPYWQIPIDGCIYRSPAEAHGTELTPGDSLLLRDFSDVLPADEYSADAIRGKWQLVPYVLADAQCGQLLLVNDVAGDDGPRAVPPAFEMNLGLTGWYAVWVGVPNIELTPILSANFTAIDLALDGEPFGGIGPEFGRRRRQLMGPTGVEVLCFWRCVQLDGRTLRFRVPCGTYQSQPWGMVRSLMSSLRLVKLNEAQVQAYHDDRARATKQVLVYNDGFGHYWGAGEPNQGIDRYTPATLGHRDYTVYFLQSPSTGVASWPSRVTSLLGEGIPEDGWRQRRHGDRRVADYIRWAVAHEQEGLRVAPAACRQAGMQCHASLRMNLFWQCDSIFGDGTDRLLNGTWWFAHPEARKSGSPQLDFAHHATRRFILDILEEMVTPYAVEGLNLDFSRWPPVADPAHHDSTVLTSFISEVRAMLDRIDQVKDTRLPLSVTLVEGAHARNAAGKIMTLEDQRIDLEAWLASGALDFVCVQTWRHEQYIDLVHRYGARYYCEFDNVPLDAPGGQIDDPEWCDAEDPLPGEELLEQPPINNVLDPREVYAAALKQYRNGADGICFINYGGRTLGRLGHVEDLEVLTSRNATWGQEIGQEIRIAWPKTQVTR